MTDILLNLWATLQDMAPYLLFGFGMAGVLSVVISPDTVERHLGGRGMRSVIKAALFGVPLPLCSCSVIPVTLTLRRHGAGRGAASAFLLSTPQTGVDSIAVTYALLGPLLAVYRPVAAFLTGVIGGGLTNLATRRQDDAGPERGTSDCACERREHDAKPASAIRRALRHGFVTLPSDAGGSMLLGLLIAGLIAAWVPDAFFEGEWGGGFSGMLAMMVLGIPIYVCATASVPIAAALIAKGISPGAALVFLMTGPATNAAGIAAVWRMMGRRTALLYLATTAVMALTAGMALNVLLEVTPLTFTAPCHAEHGRSPLAPWFAVALLAVLVAPSLRKGYRSWHVRPSPPLHEPPGHESDTGNRQ